MNNNVLYELDSRYISDVLKLRFTPANAVKAEDVYLYDIEGKKYLDMSAGWAVMNLGYSNKTVAKAIKKQIETLSFAGVISCVSKESIELAQKICGLLPGGFEKKVWYGHSGSDANEFIAKMIPYATGRPAILTFEGSYHGQTLGAYAMSGHPSLTAFAKDSSANPKLPYPDYYRDGAGMTPEEYDMKCLDYIENVFFRDKFDPYKVGAIVVEAVQSDGGDIPAGNTFLRGLEKICRKYGMYLIFDEVKIGMGRTGDMFGFEESGVIPDAVIIGKSIGAGLPLSIVAGRSEIMDCATGLHLFTTSGSSVVCAGASAMIDELTGNNIPENARNMGSCLKTELNRLKERCSYIGDVRGRGLLIGTELIKDPKDRIPATELAAKVVYRAYELGMICYYTGPASNVIEFTPPLILNEKQAYDAVSILEQAINDAVMGKVPDDKLKNFSGWA